MASKKIWNLMYVAGNPEIYSKVRSNASNPMMRAEALEAAKMISDNNWRVWVEHASTGVRIFESPVEKSFSQD